MDTKRRKIKRIFISLSLVAFFLAAVALKERLPQKKLCIKDTESGEIYRMVPVKAGDQLIFRWTHSFEKIPWDEYYLLQADNRFLLKTISVSGFGAGIPAEMDVDYRYEDGRIYMDEINSVFPAFHWINSHTALREIDLNGALLLRGEDMPHHGKMELFVEQKGVIFD